MHLKKKKKSNVILRYFQTIFNVMGEYKCQYAKCKRQASRMSCNILIADIQKDEYGLKQMKTRDV